MFVTPKRKRLRLSAARPLLLHLRDDFQAAPRGVLVPSRVLLWLHSLTRTTNWGAASKGQFARHKGLCLPAFE